MVICIIFLFIYLKLLQTILIFSFFSQDLCRRMKEGSTALHLCALFNRTESMKLLLRSRPDLVTYTNNDGKTAMDIAVAQNHNICIDLVRDSSVDALAYSGNLSPVMQVSVTEYFGSATSDIYKQTCL